MPAQLRTFTWGRAAAASVAIMAVVAAIELALGQPPICKCGHIKLWHGIVHSSENSQQISDWYTPSHVIHGFAFYFLFWLVGRRLPPGARFVAAVLLEAGWEVLENTPLIINRYRAATIAFDYAGDSVLNSMADIAAMMAGYLIARRSPVWASIAFVITMELLVAAFIRDNLTLNILMLLYPLEAIKRWQAGG